MIPIPASLALTLSYSAKNSPFSCIFCSSGVVISSNETDAHEISAQTPSEEERDNCRVIPNPNIESSSSCLSLFTRSVSKCLPGHSKRQTDEAARIFYDYLLKKYGADVTLKTLQEENWDTVKQDFRYKDIKNIKERAEKIALEANVSKTEEINVDWVVKRDDWTPHIEVEKRDLRTKKVTGIESFDPEKIRNKLKRNTQASDEEIEAVIKAVEAKILRSNEASLIISSADIRQHFIYAVTKNKIPLKSIDKFIEERSKKKGESLRE